MFLRFSSLKGNMFFIWEKVEYFLSCFFVKGLSFQICFRLAVHKNNTQNDFKILELFTIAAGESSLSTHFCKWCKLCSVIIECSQGQNISQTCFVWMIEWSQRRKLNIINIDHLTRIFPTACQSIISQFWVCSFAFLPPTFLQKCVGVFFFKVEFPLSSVSFL